jgi:hypothetical protein
VAFSSYCFVISSFILLLTVGEYLQTISTFGKTGGFTGKALSSVDKARDPVAFHRSAKLSMGVGDCEIEGLALDGEVAEGLGCGAVTDLPLFQINPFPLLIQVNFFPLCTFVSPELVHLAPAFGAGAAIEVDPEKINSITNIEIFDRIPEG